MTHLETERLRFRKWRKDDFPRFHKYFSDEENTRFLGGVKDIEGSWRTMAAYLGNFELQGFTYLAIEEKSSGVLAGTVGLWNSEGWPEPELGYWLLEESQGKGYAYEAGMKVLEFARHETDLKSLVSYIHKDNHPSIALATKLGATFDGETELLTFGLHGVYRYW